VQERFAHAMCKYIAYVYAHKHTNPHKDFATIVDNAGGLLHKLEQGFCAACMLRLLASVFDWESDSSTVAEPNWTALALAAAHLSLRAIAACSIFAGKDSLAVNSLKEQMLVSYWSQMRENTDTSEPTRARAT
jgi:hypothetical protein